MNKKLRLAKINYTASCELLEIKAIIRALLNIQDGCYPSNIILSLTERKIQKIFNIIEENRKILKISEYPDNLSE